ncbi:MAG: magnesium transporter [Tissierellia bacterium]|nr:magnesium transporter [Tissierellia bacterium]
MKDLRLLQEQDIHQLIEQKKIAELKDYLIRLNPVDLAELMEELDQPSALLVLRILPRELGVEAFAYMEVDKQKRLASLITDAELKSILEELYFDDMIDLLEEMPAEFVADVLKNAPFERRELINEFLKYPEDSAGSIMTIEYVDLKVDMTVAEAIDHIREAGMTKETVYTCYVTSDFNELVGIVSLRKLVTVDREKTIGQIMDKEIITVGTLDDQEDVVEVFKKYDFLAVPVVDGELHLTGIVTVDDIMEVIEEEATEDFQKMAAIAPTEEEYLDAGVLTLAKNRLPWLLVLMISGTFTAAIIRGYEDVLAQVAILSTFVPMLMDTGGNAGSQSSTLIIRGIAIGEIKLKDIFKVMKKETAIAIICGLILAVVNFFRLVLIENADSSVAFVVSATLVFTVLMAKLIGGALPLAAKKLHADPAIMAGPLLTTIVDVGSLIIYFIFATRFLNLHG